MLFWLLIRKLNVSSAMTTLCCVDEEIPFFYFYGTKIETLQAFGVSSCHVTVLTANGEIVNLFLCESAAWRAVCCMFQSPDSRRNLLSVSKLSHVKLQVVLQANDGIYREASSGYIMLSQIVHQRALNFYCSYGQSVFISDLCWRRDSGGNKCCVGIDVLDICQSTQFS